MEQPIFAKPEERSADIIKFPQPESFWEASHKEQFKRCLEAAGAVAIAAFSWRDSI